MSDAVAARLCLNCATPLEGFFCHRCGQKDQPARLSLKGFLHEVFQELLPYERRIVASFGLLIGRPGFLAEDYLKGRRVRHVSPFRLYLATSFVLFFLFSTVPNGRPKAGAPASAQVQVRVNDKAILGDAAPSDAPAKVKRTPAWATALKQRAKHAKDNPEGFRRTFLANLSRALFLLMPLFALLLLLLHLRCHTLFMDHMVLALHHHAFSFLVILALMGLALLPGDDWGEWPGFFLLLAPPIHLGISLQRLYQRGWVRSFVKAALVSGIYGCVVIAALVALLYFSLPA